MLTFAIAMAGRTVLAPSPVKPESKPFTSNVGRPHTRSSVVAGLAKEFRRAQFLAVLLLVERKLLPLVTLPLRQLPHVVIEAGDLHASATILHLRQDLASKHKRWVGDRPAKSSRVEVALSCPEDRFGGTPGRGGRNRLTARRGRTSGYRKSRRHRRRAADLLPCTNSSRCALPTSSSPSMKNFMFSGRPPASFM